MLRDMLLDERGDEIELGFALTAFLRRAVVASREAASADATRDHGVRDFRIRKALALMRSNMVRSLDLEAVARESGLSRPHFFSKFRDELGLTPSIFWNSLRLEAAMQQMSSSQASLASVASRLGFDAQCNFTRFFRQHTGVAPSECRHALVRRTDAAALRTCGGRTIRGLARISSAEHFALARRCDHPCARILRAKPRLAREESA